MYSDSMILYLKIMRFKTYKPQNLYIHSDNQAALQALQSASADGPAQYILKKTINKIEEMGNSLPVHLC